jgi:hypothetical protein
MAQDSTQPDAFKDEQNKFTKYFQDKPALRP